MTKITEVYLFTNRNVLIFNENGEQVVEFQKLFNDIENQPKNKIKEAIKKIKEDKPVFYIARWKKWVQEITFIEFLFLMGLKEEAQAIMMEFFKEDFKKGGRRNA